MAKIMIVPTADYSILKKYLGSGGGLILVSEESLRSLSPSAQSRCRELEKEDDVPYDFGGEPDVSIDFIHCTDSYAYGELLDESVWDWYEKMHIFQRQFTRDAQVYTGPEQYPSPLDEGWIDWNAAQIYIGMYEGSKKEAKRWAAEYAGINQESVVLISVA